MNTAQLVTNAHAAGTVIPAFNIPYLPMMEPVVRALRDSRSAGLIMVARLELFKFEAQSLAAVRDEYERVKDERFTRLHLDHVPVIDEDQQRVDFIAMIREAIELGYQSVMIDGSRLSLEENIAATRDVMQMAHEAGIPAEAELGAVMGHEDGPMPPYDELFASGKGFTDIDDAARFVAETKTDWLSVAIGNVHGAISAAKKNQAKIRARLNIDHLDHIRQTTKIPLVLHGGTGIANEDVRESFRHGIAKINIATAIRQVYERTLPESLDQALEAVYQKTMLILRDDLDVVGSADTLGLAAQA